MFKKFVVSVVTVFVFSFFVSVAVSASDLKTTVDKSNAANGLISVKVEGSSNNKIMALVKKDGSEYKYYLKPGTAVNIPLQMGTGNYTITVAENVAGSKFMQVHSEEITVNSIDENQLYLNSIQMINFNDNMTAVKELNKLLTSAGNDKEKVEIIHNYIVKNISYDYDKVSQVSGTSGYIPVIDDVYASKQGICYDYSSLLASILRNNGIPTRLQTGYFTEIPGYHAWNEVFLDGKWMKIDATYDAQADSANVSYSMVKDNSEFKIVYQY